MIGRAFGCAVHAALYVVVASIVAIALGLLFGQLQLRSTPRGGPDSGGHEASALALPGAPSGDAVPRTRGTEPATTPDPVQQAAVGAPIPTASWGLGTPRGHSTGLTAAIRQPGATPRPSPRPAVVPSAARAGTAGGVRDGAPPAAFNGLHPIAESWRSTGTASGIASHMGAGFPAGYLALPIGPGYFVRICGAGGCVEMRSTDAGPDLAMQREGRVADLSVAVFVKVCGVPAGLGLCQVSVTVIGRAR